MDIKKLAAISLMTLSITTCSVPGATAHKYEPKTKIEQSDFIKFLENRQIELTMLAEQQAKAKAELLKEQARIEQIQKNTRKIEYAVNKLEKYVDKTWYVRSGSSTKGWDCSGLVLWMYEQIGIELEHSASKQLRSGEIVKNPKLGDIVAFSYSGSKGAYHVGIYIDDDKMIHVGQKGERTSIASISKFANGTKVSYIRILETN